MTARGRFAVVGMTWLSEIAVIARLSPRSGNAKSNHHGDTEKSGDLEIGNWAEVHAKLG
jgi:hypothetical protein